MRPSHYFDLGLPGEEATKHCPVDHGGYRHQSEAVQSSSVVAHSTKRAARPSTVEPKLKELQVQPPIKLESDLFEMGDLNESEVLVKSKTGFIRVVDAGDHRVYS
jgi:hypothetical protein